MGTVFDIVCVLICGAVVSLACIGYFADHKANRLEALANWLKWAVVQAEKELGGKTGQLKLQMVYDMAVSRFSWLASAVTFEEFSIMVDNALGWMREQVEKNANIKKIVEGDKNV